MKNAKKKSKSSSKAKEPSLAHGYSALYERKYLYFLGITLLVILLVIVIKILPSFAKQQGVLPINKLGCANSVIDDNSTMRNKLLKDELSDTFGITLKGDVGSDIDRPLEIYNTMCKLNGYGKFFSMIRANGRKINLTINIGEGRGCGSGFTPNRNTIYMGWCSNQAENRFIMVHEMGHVIRYRNDNGRGGTVFSNFAKNVYHDLKCSDNFDTCSTNLYDHPSPNRLKTENCWFAGYRDKYGRPTLGTWMESECFSDTIGEFLVYNSFIYRVSSGANISSIRSQYIGDGWNSFAQYNIFGGSSNGVFNANEFGIKGAGNTAKPTPTPVIKPASYKKPTPTPKVCKTSSKQACYYGKWCTQVSNSCSARVNYKNCYVKSGYCGVPQTCSQAKGYCATAQYCHGSGGQSITATGCSSGQICCK